MNVARNADPLKIGRWVLVALLLILPALIFESRGYYLRMATLVLMFAGLGGAWNILSGFANQVSLGHAAFFGVGAYTSTLLLKFTGLSPWLGMLVAGGAAGLLSLVVAVPTFRLRGHYFALGTLAFAEILRVLFLYFKGITEGPIGLTVPFRDSIWFFQFSGSLGYYLTALALLCLTFFAAHRVKVSRLGYELRALSSSHEAAEVVGVDTYRAKLWAAILSAGFTGCWGTFYAQYTYFIDPDTVFGVWTISVKIAMVAILGGLGTIWGPLVGSAILIPLDEWTSAVFIGDLAAVSRLIYGCLLIALILWQPRGLLSWFSRLEGLPPTGKMRKACRKMERIA
ncbi:MAG: branched-chain amino acid ABC transporter permease [Deltaproteobacteria bacterium]